MTAKDMFKTIGESYYSPDSSYDKDGVTVSISLSPIICTLRLSAPVSDPETAAVTVDIVNRGQDLCRYFVDDGALVLKTSIWVDGKPTKTGLQELTNYVMAEFKSVHNMIEGVISNG